MSDPVELLPCPFCGCDNAMMLGPTCRPETPYNPADRLFPIVRCGSCCAEVSGKNEDYRGKSAIAAWNRRPPNRDGVLEEVPWPGRQFCEIAGRNAEKLARKMRNKHDARAAADAVQAINTLLAALKTQDQEHGGSDA